MSDEIQNIKKRIPSPKDDFEIAISLDYLESYLILKPNNPGKIYTVEEILEILQHEGIVNGILSDEITDTIDAYNNMGIIPPATIIVKGTPAIQGKNAIVDLNFDVNKKAELKVDAEGNIDYRELGLINNVSKGELLAKKTPFVVGEAGLDIYGEQIQPSPLRDDNFVAGKNTYVCGNGLECRAAVDGQVLLKKKMIHISTIYTVAHDVDLTTGNISFNGSIIIHGNVLSGFTVKAKEDITVLGVVEAATVIAGGSIYIKTGFKGSDKGLIKARGGITTKFIETGTIECYGDLLVETSIINANVTCYANIHVTRNKGLIVGGDIKCVGDIYCNEIGSKLGVSTRVTLGDKFIIRMRLEETQVEANKLLERAQKIASTLLPMKPLLNNLDILPPEERNQFETILEQQSLLQGQIQQLEAKKKKLMTLYNVLCNSKLYIKTLCYPSSAITIGTSKRNISSPFSNLSFFENPQSKMIAVGAYSPPKK
ncbi:FapA family protein [bacterium]|nr:FapA family protein [bacterium]